MECRFVVNGRRFVATAEQVEAALRDVTPEAVRVHGVEIGGQVYPAKQAFAVAFGLERADFSTHSARGVFRRLGFDVSAVPPPPKPKRKPAPKKPRERAKPPEAESAAPPKRRVVRLHELLPHRSIQIGPGEVQGLELAPLVLRWARWERWEDLAEYGVEIMDMSPGQPGVYEVTLHGQQERLTIGKAADLRTRILQALIKGTTPHTAGQKIRRLENLNRVLVRWALTDRPATAEEELHRRHIATFGRLPKYTSHT